MNKDEQIIILTKQLQARDATIRGLEREITNQSLKAIGMVSAIQTLRDAVEDYVIRWNTGLARGSAFTRLEQALDQTINYQPKEKDYD